MYALEKRFYFADVVSRGDEGMGGGGGGVGQNTFSWSFKLKFTFSDRIRY